MKKVALFVILLALSCNTNDKTLTELVRQINIFEKHREYFKDISISSIRDSNNPNPLEFMVRKNYKAGYAVIQTKPHLKILKNFVDTPLDTNFLSIFAKIDCRYLYSNKDYVEIVSILDDKKIITFFGTLPDNEKSADNEILPIEGLAGWKIKKSQKSTKL